MRRTPAGALVLAAAVALSGCTAATSRPPSSSSSSTPGTEALDPQATGPAPAVPEARRGGSLVVRSQNGPSTLDPTRQYYVDSQAILKLTNRTLTTYAVRGGRDVLVPDLATDLGRVSADGLTWTFTLKEGLTYEDGSPVRAADVVHAVRRSFAQDELPGGPTYQMDHLKGGQDYRGPYQDGTAFAGVEAKGDRDVVLHLSEPWSSVPYFTTFTIFSPVPAARDTRGRYGDHPLATGPYRFGSYVAGRSLTLVRNPHWEAASDPARHDLLDSITFEWGADRLATQRSILDRAPGTERVLTYDALEAELEPRARAAGPQLVQGASPCVELVSMDTRQIPLAVRRAVAAAYPWTSVARAGGVASLTTTPRRSYAPPQLAGAADQQVPGIPVTGDGDPAAARRLLEQAGKLGFELSWYFAQDQPTARAQSEARAQKLRAAGFSVRTIGVPRQQLRDLSVSLDAPVNMLQGPKGWCYDWPNGDAVYPPLFSSTARREQMTPGGLADAAVDERMRAIAAKPLTQQPTEWAALDKELLQKYLPALPGGNDRSTFLSGTGVKGVVNDPNLGLPDFSAIHVAG